MAENKKSFILYCEHYLTKLYNKKAIELHGEYAFLNTIDPCSCPECKSLRNSTL